MQDTIVVCDFLISYAASPAPLSLPEATASRDGEKMGGDQASTTQPNCKQVVGHWLLD